MHLGLLAVLVWALLGGRPIPANAASGTTYVVQSGDTLGLIAANYGTTIDAIVQANGLAGPDTIYAGQTLTIPSQAAAAGTAPASASSSVYVVKLGDTLRSIADGLGVSAAALADTNGVTNPDLLYVGQQLRVPGSTLGSAASAPPAPPAAQSDGLYVVQPGDTLNAIAQSLGVSASDLADANALTDADLLVVGQKLTLPGSGTVAQAAATAPPQPTSQPQAAAGAPYVVQPGDTLNTIAAKLGVDAAALAQANGIQNADLLSVGQSLVVPGAAGEAAQQPSPAATPDAAGSAGESIQYTVRSGDTLSSIAVGLGVDAAALAQVNNLGNTDVLSVGQTLVVPSTGVQAATAAVATPVTSPASPGSPDSNQIQYKVQPGDTLGKIAQKYNTTAAQIARTNQLTSPNLVSVGMTLLIPAPAWTAPNLSGPPSRFVVSIKLQRCWLYQGSSTVANWPCSTGQAGTDTHPGSYKIQSKMDRAFGSTWNIWMPYWLGLYWAGASENGIHGIPYGATNSTWRLWEGFVGTPVTYGCVLLDDVHAKQLYDMAYIGMPVIIQP